MPATNGPYVVEGSLTLVSSDGLTRAARGPRVAFCRCGHSRNKPFCDGSHLKGGFPRPRSGIVSASARGGHHSGRRVEDSEVRPPEIGLTPCRSMGRI